MPIICTLKCLSLFFFLKLLHEVFDRKSKQMVANKNKTQLFQCFFVVCRYKAGLPCRHFQGNFGQNMLFSNLAKAALLS